jgi:tellurite resistance protein TerC
MLNWEIFFGVVSALLIFDLCFLNRSDHKLSFDKSMKQSAFFVGVGLLFGLWIQYSMGTDSSLKYYNGYLIELALSIDNIFIISLIFLHFNVDPKYQHRALFWGIIGAILFRGLMIYVGVGLVERFSWILYIFAFILIYTSWHLYRTMDEKPDLKDNLIVKIITQYIPLYPKEGKNFLIYDSKWFITRTGMALCVIEFMDLIFAIDSIPAIFAITTDSYLVYSSNIFAIMGLRAMYFGLSGVIEKFFYIKYSLVAILFLIGIKILIHNFITLSPVLPLAVTLVIFGAGIIASIYLPQKIS